MPLFLSNAELLDRQNPYGMHSILRRAIDTRGVHARDNRRYKFSINSSNRTRKTDRILLRTRALRANIRFRERYARSTPRLEEERVFPGRRA